MKKNNLFASYLRRRNLKKYDNDNLPEYIISANKLQTICKLYLG